MTPSRSRRRRRRAQALQVPTWYYIVLGAIVLVGIALIVVSGLVRVHESGVTAEGDHFKGRADAPVTIIGWGNFT